MKKQDYNKDKVTEGIKLPLNTQNDKYNIINYFVPILHFYIFVSS